MKIIPSIHHPPRLSPLSLWDPELTPTFSASVNDAVLEKLLQLLELRSGRFVEIGVSAMGNLHEWWETQGKSLWKRRGGNRFSWENHLASWHAI